MHGSCDVPVSVDEHRVGISVKSKLRRDDGVGILTDGKGHAAIPGEGQACGRVVVPVDPDERYGPTRCCLLACHPGDGRQLGPTRRAPRREEHDRGGAPRREMRPSGADGRKRHRGAATETNKGADGRGTGNPTAGRNYQRHDQHGGGGETDTERTDVTMTTRWTR